MKLITGYKEFVNKLQGRMRSEEALEAAIGDGDFDAFGILETDLLIDSGLMPNSYLIDVGCGSGRLAKPISHYLAQQPATSGRYLGIDVVPDLVEHARKLASRPDWRFEVMAEDAFSIPEADGVADMAVFFSVFTHLRHEQSYLYLQDALRVLKPGGTVIFSFLEFRIQQHWRVFDETVAGIHATLLNQFMDRDMLAMWVQRLGVTLVGIYDGDKPHFRLRRPVKLAENQIMEEQGHLGQSVCILRKPHTAT